MQRGHTRVAMLRFCLNLSMQDMRRSTGRSRLCHCPLPCRDETRSAGGTHARPRCSAVAELCPRTAIPGRASRRGAHRRNAHIPPDATAVRARRWCGEGIGYAQSRRWPCEISFRAGNHRDTASVATHERARRGTLGILADLDNASVVILRSSSRSSPRARPPRPAKRSIASLLAWRVRSLVTILPGAAKGRSWVSSSVIGLL